VYLWSPLLGGECCAEVMGPNAYLDDCAYAEDIRERAQRDDGLESDPETNNCSDHALNARISIRRYELGQPTYFWLAGLTVSNDCKHICGDVKPHAFDTALVELLERPLSQAQRLAIRRNLRC
jgi:hypothetical protein